MFIVVEGIDGSGKTTISRKLQEKLSACLTERRVVWHRAPDGPIRDLLLNRTSVIAPKTEVLLFIACHQWLLTNSIIPALKAGHVVVLDRFTDTTISYQGAGRKVGVNHVTGMVMSHISEQFVELGVDVSIFQPDHTIYVNVPQAISEARLEARGGQDYMDQAGPEFRARVAKQMRIQKNTHETAFLLGDSKMAVSEIRNDTSMEDLDRAIDAWIEEHLPAINATAGDLVRRDQLVDWSKQ